MSSEPNLQPEDVNTVQLFLRKWCHDANNALFVAIGLLEEMIEDLSDQIRVPPLPETEKNRETASAVLRAVSRLENQVSTLRHFAKDEVFEHKGLAKPII